MSKDKKRGQNKTLEDNDYRRRGNCASALTYINSVAKKKMKIITIIIINTIICFTTAFTKTDDITIPTNLEEAKIAFNMKEPKARYVASEILWQNIAEKEVQQIIYNGLTGKDKDQLENLLLSVNKAYNNTDENTQIATINTTEKVLNNLKNDPNLEKIRGTLLQQLTNVTTPKTIEIAVDYLCNLLGGQEQKINPADITIRLLGKFVENETAKKQIMKALNGRDNRKLRGALYAIPNLIKTEPTTKDILIKSLYSIDEKIAITALNIVGEVAEDNKELLNFILKNASSSDNEKRKSAMNSLAYLAKNGCKPAMIVIEEALSDKNDLIATMAFNTVLSEKEIPPERILALAKIAEKHNNPIKGMVASKLCEFCKENKEARSILSKMIKSLDDYGIAAMAEKTHYLWELDNGIWKQFVLTASKNKDAKIKESSISSLAKKINEPESKEALEKLTKDPNQKVKAKAAKALVEGQKK